MKIVNTESGQAYQLNPDTQLEVERTNLFFNEWGEQTLPVDLPDTDLNRKLLGYPDMLSNKKKPATSIPCTVQDGEYFMPCRQAILGAKRKSGISTSFYMNEGSFMSMLEDTSLKEMFGSETVPGITTVAQGIAFCKSLLNQHNDNYACFPVMADFDGSKKYINKVEWMNADGDYYVLSTRPTEESISSLVMGFYHEFQRTETSGDNTILLSPGYYITPFLKANYLLRRIFSYFGYTLQTNFFDTTSPFNDMVFLNNTMDSLVNGTILLAHLVPDCTCSTILNLFRKKFNCEFISDEIEKTVSVEFFRDIISAPSTTYLSDCLTDQLDADFSKEWNQLKLSSESTVDDGSTFDSLPDLLLKYPEAFVKGIDGCYYHTGYSNTYVEEKIGASTIPYRAEGSLKDKEVVSPDTAIPLIIEEESTLKIFTIDGRTVARYRYRPLMHMPYIGDANALNSTIVIGSTTSTSDTEADETTASNKEQNPIICFVYTCNKNFTLGTTTSHSYNNVKLWEYSLHYNGAFGIFEKFYRKYDDLLRNSLIPTKATLLLSSNQKKQIPAQRKIIINGSEFLIDKLKYHLGGKNEPVESELLTVQLYEPITSAVSESSRFTDPIYKWRIKETVTIITEEQYNSAVAKAMKLSYIYPKPPTEAQYNAGGDYYTRTYYKIASRNNVTQYQKRDVSLNPILYTDSNYSTRS